jgi:hypothetical protein
MMISDLINQEQNILKNEIEQEIDTKFKELENEYLIPELHPIKLDLMVEKKDIRMEKYLQMVEGKVKIFQTKFLYE